MKKTAFSALAQPKAPAKKTTNIPVIAAPESIVGDILDWAKKNEIIKNAESDRSAAESLILPVAEKCRVEASTEKGENLASVRLDAGKVVVTITTKCMYSAIAPTELPALQQAFGQDYDKFFETKEKIEVREDADLDALIALVGPERLQEFFAVSNTTKPTQAFHDARSTNPNIAATAEPFMGTTIRHAKPGITTYTS